MPKPVVVPDLGAGQAVLSVWFANPGEPIYEGDRLVEILLPGATVDVLSPATGRLGDKRAWPDDPLTPGQVLGFVDEDNETI